MLRVLLAVWVAVRDHQDLFIDAIHYDAWGRIPQARIPLILPGRSTRRKSFSVITAIPISWNRTLCVVSYLGKHQDLIEQDEWFEWIHKPKITEEELKQKVSDHLLNGMSLYYGDQLILAPRFYESLSAEKQEELKKELNTVEIIEEYKSKFVFLGLNIQSGNDCDSLRRIVPACLRCMPNFILCWLNPSYN